MTPDLDRHPRVAQAVAWSREHDADTLARQVRISEVPAPPFDEGARADLVAELMLEVGLTDVSRDEVGNVISWRSEPGPNPLVVSAHLDTVFPPETDVAVTRDGEILRGPGIADDARGLATLLTVAGALQASGCAPGRPLAFVATVGEEGLGDLRGVKHLFGAGGAARDAAGFISLDGAGLDRIVTRGLGSRRYRITIRGPGGHSWIDWGAPNPLHALSELGSRIAGLQLSEDPRATLTLARTGGGTSINAIPQEAWVEVDTRCAEPHPLDALESGIRVAAGQVEERHAGVAVTIEIVGDRPAGSTPEDHALVQAAFEATRRVGAEPRPALSSTDANVPMAHGVPAVTLGCGGEAGQIHTTQEWYSNDGGVEGVARALYTVLLFTGLPAG